MHSINRLALVFLAATALGGTYNGWFSARSIPWVMDWTKSVRTNPELLERISVPIEQVQEALLSGGEVFLVDARSSNDYAEGHIPGAVNVAVDEVLEGTIDVYALVPPEAEVIVYCGDADCEDSGRLYDWLIPMGYEHVRIFVGGMIQWEQVYPSQIEMGMEYGHQTFEEEVNQQWEETNQQWEVIEMDNR